MAGDELQVNAKADYGQLTVEMLDEEGNPIPGHTAQDCVAITEDGVAVPVRWRDGRDLQRIARTASTPALRTAQRPPVRLLVFVAFGPAAISTIRFNNGKNYVH